MDQVRIRYHAKCATPSDINEHLPTLYEYANKCSSVLELGVRGCVSSWAFATGLLDNENAVDRRLVMNDLTECNISELLEKLKGLDIKTEYIWKNDLEIELEQPVDLTFIDTWHVYAQLKRELAKFAPLTKKYIIMHDTTVDGERGETIRNGWCAEKQSKETGFPVDEINKGLWPAVEEFLTVNPKWKLKIRYTNNNGLTILEKI